MSLDWVGQLLFVLSEESKSEVVPSKIPDADSTSESSETQVVEPVPTDFDQNSGLATVTETASNTFSMQTGWSDGDHEFTFSGDNDIAVNNALVIVGTFTSSDSSNHIQLVQDVYSPDPKEQNRQYQKEVDQTVWEGQDNMNARFKVCN